jgi:thiamine-monophosphate kinase
MVRLPLIQLGAGGEFDLIRRILDQDDRLRATLHGSPVQRGGHVLLGPGGDCAIITGEAIALSIDASIEGVHFRRDWLGPEAIGYRAAAAALSDLAAVAAAPIGLLVTLAVPPAEEGLASSIMAGVTEAAAATGASLLGGDLSASPGPIVIDIVVAGEVTAALTRGGARPGDEIWVTGQLGAAAAAVRAWQADRQPTADARLAYERPTPRIREARWLSDRGLITAAIDLSDGVAGDAGHMAAASGVAIRIETAAVPVHAAARAAGRDADDALTLALGGGEDYELLVAMPAGAAHTTADAFEHAFGVRLTRIGSVARGSGVIAVTADGIERPMPVRGYTHFGGGA